MELIPTMLDGWALLCQIMGIFLASGLSDLTSVCHVPAGHAPSWIMSRVEGGGGAMAAFKIYN